MPQCEGLARPSKAIDTFGYALKSQINMTMTELRSRHQATSQIPPKIDSVEVHTHKKRSVGPYRG